MNEFLSLLKIAAMEQEQAMKPVAVTFGTVVGEQPLEIMIDQKMTLTESFLILTKSVIDYSVDMTVSHVTQPHTHSHVYTDDGSKLETQPHTHTHEYSGKKRFTVHHGLKNGDKVILLRIQGGKKFIVLDIIGGGSV